VFVLNEVQGDFIQVITELFEEFCADNNAFEHDSAWANLTEKDEVGFAFSGVDLFFKKLDLFIDKKVLLLEVDKLFVLFRRVLEIGKLIFECL
jgi:hypothetical protein